MSKWLNKRKTNRHSNSSQSILALHFLFGTICKTREKKIGFTKFTNKRDEFWYSNEKRTINNK